MKLLKLMDVKEAKYALKEQFEKLLKKVNIDIEKSLGYVLCKDIISEENVPNFRKSTVDGYAIKSNETIGASENMPIPFTLKGELEISSINDILLNNEECMYIPTGGMVPNNADAVVKIEQTERIDDLIMISKSCYSGENIIEVGEDLKKGTCVLKKGTKLDERSIGVLASLGIYEVPVYDRLRVMIISSGDELIDVRDKVSIAKNRDVNTYYIKNLLMKNNFEIVGSKLIRDNADLYYNTLTETEADIYVTSGGSSKGKYDFTYDVFEKITNGGVFCHGISIKPGKPTILASNNNKLYIGLPGHPLSAYFVLQELFIGSFNSVIGYNYNNTIKGKLKSNIAGIDGKRTIMLAKIEYSDGYYVVPIPFKSSSIVTLPDVDGYFIIREGLEGFNKNTEVEVIKFE